MIKRILNGILVVLAVLIAIPVAVLAYLRLTYYNEMRAIEKKLNAMQGVEVVNIWGHDDITLEEVTARLRIHDRGELVLYGLSRDVFNYPKTVWVSEIGGFSFEVFHTNSIGSTIDIGTEGCFGKFFPFTFTTEVDVIRHYDEILQIVRSWPVWPELLHFVSDQGQETFLAVLPMAKKDQDPIYDLLGAKSLFEFKNTLPWGRWSESSNNAAERISVRTNAN